MNTTPRDVISEMVFGSETRAGGLKMVPSDLLPPGLICLQGAYGQLVFAHVGIGILKCKYCHECTFRFYADSNGGTLRLICESCGKDFINREYKY
jgi:hypothetical protein